jgi:CBS domain-containing protein
MFAQDLMTRPAITCHVNDPLSAAARAMWDHDIGAIAIVNDEGKLTGMLTDRDICMAAYTQSRALDEILVNSAMARKVVSARPDARLGQIEQLMAQHQLRRIPIVDGDGLPIGMVSLNDVAIASAGPRTEVPHAATRLTHTLASICRPRQSKQRAA